MQVCDEVPQYKESLYKPNLLSYINTIKGLCKYPKDFSTWNKDCINLF